MSESEKSIPLAVSLPESLIAEIDSVAASARESRSSIMRKAIREGIPLIKSGGAADSIILDSAFSAEIDALSQETDIRRNKILLEAIRAGLHAYGSKVMSEKMSLAQLKDPNDKQRMEEMLQMLEESYKRYDDPMVREHRRLIRERGVAVTRLLDILWNVPEARRRHHAVNRLTEIRRSPGGGGGGPAWMSGLSTEEMEWQIAMSDKYGPASINWPKEEVTAHYAAEEERKSKEPRNQEVIDVDLS